MSDLPPPYTWRAGSGYLPPPAARPPSYQLLSPASPPICITQQHIALHLPPPPSYHVVCGAPPGPAQQVFYLPSRPPKPKKDDKDDDKKKGDDGKKAKADAQKKGPNPNAPPKLRAGANYMFPPEHTKLHILNKAARVWQPKYQGRSFDFKIFTVSTHFTVAMVIENVLRRSGDAAAGWAATEIIERGDGEWTKGTTIEYGTDKAKGSLASMGWTAKRGEELPPVWAVVHKVEKKKK